jgi:uncharacterized membrane protein
MTLAAWAPWTLAAAVSAWVAAVLLAPILPGWPSAVAYAVSSLVCHQLPERSFYWGAVQFAVCARCTGIYAGAAGAAMAAALAEPSSLAALRPYIKPTLLAAAAPVAGSVVAEWLHVWAPSHAVRFATGLPVGAAVLVTIAIALHYGDSDAVRRRP